MPLVGRPYLASYDDLTYIWWLVSLMNQRVLTLNQRRHPTMPPSGCPALRGGDRYWTRYTWLSFSGGFFYSINRLNIWIRLECSILIVDT